MRKSLALSVLLSQVGGSSAQTTVKSLPAVAASFSHTLGRVPTLQQYRFSTTIASSETSSATTSAGQPASAELSKLVAQSASTASSSSEVQTTEESNASGKNGNDAVQVSDIPGVHPDIRQFFEEAQRESSDKINVTQFVGKSVTSATLKKDMVQEAFKVSVQGRSVGNRQLKLFIQSMDTGEWEVAHLAAKGAQEAGLRLDAETCESLLALYVRAGQLKSALELYQNMVKNRVCPHTNSFNHLMRVAVNKDSAYAAQTIYADMIRKGRAPNAESYELLLHAYALESTPQWEKAVELFDTLQARRNYRMNAQLYNSLMRVYLKMHPFDYRIVYNAYYEMRYENTPKVYFGWETYDLVDEALRRGGAGKRMRFMLWLDTHLQTMVPLRSKNFWGLALGLLVFFIVLKMFSFALFNHLNNKARGDSEHGLEAIEPSGYQRPREKRKEY